MKYLFVVASFLLCCDMNILAMEEKKENSYAFDVAVIKRLLKKNDPQKILMRPDENGIYSMDAFIENLKLPKNDLKRLLGNYCDGVKGVIKSHLIQKEEYPEKLCTYPKNKPTEPKAVMKLLMLSLDDPKKAADIRLIEGCIWMLQKTYSLNTGANLFNVLIEPNVHSIDSACYTVRKMKERVCEELLNDLDERMGFLKHKIKELDIQIKQEETAQEQEKK